MSSRGGCVPKYNGILVYSYGDELQAAFYEKVCQGRMLTQPSYDIWKSYITVDIELSRLRDKIIPNIFVASGVNDFSMPLYRSNSVFKYLEKDYEEYGLEIKLFNIVEAPTLQRCLCKDDKEDSSVSAAKMDSVMHKGKSEIEFYKDWVGALDVDKIVKTTPVFAELAEVLYPFSG
jgi:hypothetical protein